MLINRYSQAGAVLILFLFAIPARAEITVASSVEWLTYSSDVIAVGKIVDVKPHKGPGAVVYDDCTLGVTELIKSPAARNEIVFTFRRFERDQSAVAWQRDGSELLVFLSLYKDQAGDEHFDGALVPTSQQFPLSLIKLAAPGKYVIDISFKVLKDRGAVLRATHAALRMVKDYLEAGGAKSIKRHYLEVRPGVEAHESLYAGSSCYLYVPSFMSKESRANFY